MLAWLLQRLRGHDMSGRSPPGGLLSFPRARFREQSLAQQSIEHRRCGNPARACGHGARQSVAEPLSPGRTAVLLAKVLRMRAEASLPRALAARYASVDHTAGAFTAGKEQDWRTDRPHE